MKPLRVYHLLLHSAMKQRGWAYTIQPHRNQCGSASTAMLKFHCAKALTDDDNLIDTAAASAELQIELVR